MRRSVRRSSVIGAIVAVVILAAVFDRDLTSFRAPTAWTVLAGFAWLLWAGLAWPATKFPRWLWIVMGAVVGLATASYLGHGKVDFDLGLRAAIFGLAVGGLAGSLTKFASHSYWVRASWIVAGASLVVGSLDERLGRDFLASFASALSPGHSVTFAAWVVGVAALALVFALVATGGNPRSARLARVGARDFAARIIIKSPAVGSAIVAVLRAPLEWYLEILVGAILLGRTASLILVGSIPGSYVVVGGVLLLGWAMTRDVSGVISDYSLVGLLPGSLSAYRRRYAIPFIVVAVVSLGVGLLVSGSFSSHVLVLGSLSLLGVALGVVGVGVAMRAIANEVPEKGRYLRFGVPILLAACALAPVIQWNTARTPHSLEAEAILTGTLFSLVVGLIGTSFVSWWRARVLE